MATKIPYQTTFEVWNEIKPIYSGGSVALENLGSILATTLGEDALLTDFNTGKQLAKIEGDGEFLSTLTLTPSASHLITCSRSLSMRIYSLKPPLDENSTIKHQLLRTLKPHAKPVIVLAVDRTSTLLATGAADGVVKVWDIAGGYTTHTLRGSNVLISALHFFELAARSQESGISVRDPKDKRKSEEVATRGFRLAAGSQDGKVRVWDLQKKKCALLDSHVSDVTAIDFSPDKYALLTASRDKTIMWWDAGSWKVKNVVPVLEELETAGFVDSGKYTYTGGINGNIRIWQTEDGREITLPQSARGETEAIIDSFVLKDYIISIQSDHTITLYSTRCLDGKDKGMIPPLEVVRTISGTHDEIIDLGYLLPDRSLLALATNSEDIKIVSLGEGIGYFGADVAQLKGHDDIIICLDIDWSGHWIATGSKDNTARLWRVDHESTTCYAIFTGHAESIGAIGLPSQIPLETSPAFKSPLEHPPAYMVTGSQDQTIKKWVISGKTARALYTRKAHDKDINAIDINDSSDLFASASQDKTVKIWAVDEGEVQGILRGHRRGVWSVKFAPQGTSLEGSAKGLILTGSGDKTVKIWSLSDYTCLRTCEGHSHSVLKVSWLNVSGKYVQMASAGGDGLIKVWDAHTGELTCTLDNHEDRVWALAVHPTTNMIVSGSGDSTVTFWKDSSTSTQAASTAAATQLVEKEQELQNYIHAKAYRQAITLALQFNHPGRLLTLFKAIVTNPEPGRSLSGCTAVDEVLSSLSDEQIMDLLLRIQDWNTNAKTAPVAQKILWTVMKSYSAARLSHLKTRGGNDVWNTLRIYSEKHYKRLDELIDASYLIEYTLRGMDGLDLDQEVGGPLEK